MDSRKIIKEIFSKEFLSTYALVYKKAIEDQLFNLIDRCFSDVDADILKVPNLFKISHLPLIEGNYKIKFFIEINTTLLFKRYVYFLAKKEVKNLNYLTSIIVSQFNASVFNLVWERYKESFPKIIENIMVENSSKLFAHWENIAKQSAWLGMTRVLNYLKDSIVSEFRL